MHLSYHVHEIDAMCSFQLSVVSKRRDREIVRTGRREGWKVGVEVCVMENLTINAKTYIIEQQNQR